VAKRSDRPRFQRSFRRLGDLAVWLLIAAVPLIVVTEAENAFRLPKLLASEWLGLASLLAYALAAAVAGGARSGSVATPWWRRPVLLAAAPVVAAASLGLATGEHPVLTREALLDLWIAAACLVGWSLAVTGDRLERFVRGLAVPGVLLSVFGILQYHGAFRPFRFTGGAEAFRTGVTSLAGNAGDLGAFLVLPALIAQWALAEAWRKRRAPVPAATPSRGKSKKKGKGAAEARAKRPTRQLGPIVLWAGALVLSVYGLVVTQTLTAILALSAGSSVLWLVRLPARKAAALAGGVAVLAGLVATAVPPVRERVVSAARQAAEGEWNAALTGRLDGWRAAAWMFRQQPVTGIGHGAYRAEFAPAKLALQDDGVEFYPGHVDPFFANAHNDFLEAAAEWGAVGLLALAWALFVLARALLRWRTAGRRGRDLAGAALAGGLVLALGHFPFHLALVAYPYLVLLAWIFRRGAEAPDPAEAAGEEEAAGGEGAGTAGRPAWLPWLAAGLAALALVAQTGRARDRITASKQLRVVKAVSEQMASAGRAVDLLMAGNFRLLREAERLDPSEVGIAAALAGQYMLLEQWDQAIGEYRELLEREPRPEIYLNLGRALREASRDDEARDAFEKAVRLAPRLRSELPLGVRIQS
jgi:O-antigen ligase